MPGSYIAWWDEKTDEQKRAVVQDLLDKHGGQFSPDPLIREWLLRQAEVDTDGR